MIPEREREALMRLTMCAREECDMCKYKDTCGFDFQYETATRCMNILAEALRKLNSSEIPNNCETCIWSVCNYNRVDWEADTPQTDIDTEEFVKGMKNLKMEVKQTDCPWK